MTYAEVLRRMVELMFISPSVEQQAEDDAMARGARHEFARHENWTPTGRWLDSTFHARVITFSNRARERYGLWTPESASELATKLKSHPADAVDGLIAELPILDNRLLCEEDADFFLNLCSTGGKPVNFIPVIDGDLIVWFKKDSLWYSEDLAAVPELDPDRVCILQGPVSNYFNTKSTQSAAEILDGIFDGMEASLSMESVNESDTPATTKQNLLSISSEFLTPELLALRSRVTISKSADGTSALFTVSDAEVALPAELAWFEALGASSPGWLRSILTSTQARHDIRRSQLLQPS